MDGLHPAIIPWEDWQRAQEIRQSRYIPSQNHGQVANVLGELIRAATAAATCSAWDKTSVTEDPLHRKGLHPSAKYDLVEQRAS